MKTVTSFLPPSWAPYMRRALILARLAWAVNEVPVGAVVVDEEGVIVGHGLNLSVSARDPCAHAEIAALRAAGKNRGNYRLSGCTLVVTLEPCLMCLGGLVHARVARVVFGTHDPKGGALHSRLRGVELPFLNHRPAIEGPILEEECREILQMFFRWRRKDRQRLPGSEISFSS